MTLPAHRYLERANQSEKQRTWVFDFDGTITHAPNQLARIAVGLRALGDRIIVLTGNTSSRADLVAQLSDVGFPYDELVQYHDESTDGIDRAEYMKQFDAWGAFDNRVDRAVTFSDICPTFYLVGRPLGERSPGTKKAAKQVAKELKREEERSAPKPPPNLRPCEGQSERCGTCEMGYAWAGGGGKCSGYDLPDGRPYPVETDEVCDSWAPERSDS